jgi:uncharacterized membrane protein
VELKEGAKFCKACGSGHQDGAKQNDKKARVLAAEKKRGRSAVVIGIIAVAVAIGVLFAVTSGRKGPAGAGSAGPEITFTTVSAEGGVVKLPVDGIRGSEAHYYVFTAGGKEVKFFALRAADGTIRVALDACQACYRAKLGYHQQGDTMVCNNCGLSFRSLDIGIIHGGCNPVPLQNRTEGNLVVVQAKDLVDGAKFF